MHTVDEHALGPDQLAHVTTNQVHGVRRMGNRTPSKSSVNERLVRVGLPVFADAESEPLVIDRREGAVGTQVIDDAHWTTSEPPPPGAARRIIRAFLDS